MFASDARKFLGLNAVVVAVSMDSLETLRAFSEHVNADYPMGSDRQSRTATSGYRVPLIRGEFAQRSVFVIDPEGKLRYVNYRYRIREDYPAVLEVLERIRAAGGGGRSKGNR